MPERTTLKFLRILACAPVAIIAISLPAFAAYSLPGVGPVAFSASNGGVVLTVPGRGGHPYRVTWLTNPYRLAVDIQGMWLPPGGSSLYLGQGLVTQIRAARQSGNIVRVVFDLRGPADLKTENRDNALRLRVFPRGVAAKASPPPAVAHVGPLTTAPRMMPLPQGFAPAPMAVPTPRPLPPYPGYILPYQAFNPQVRITPVPLVPPIATPAPVSTPIPLPAATEPPPSPDPDAGAHKASKGTEDETPGPKKSSFPFDEDPFADEAEPPFVTVLGNRAWLGGGFLLNLNETYAAGSSNTTVNGIPALELGAEPLFTKNVGAAFGFRMQGYGIQDADEQLSGVVRTYLRDEMEGHLGVRGRFDLAPGLEVYAQPQGVFRNISVAASVRGATAAQPDPDAVLSNDFLVQSHQAFGGGLGLGLGYRLSEFFALVASGEFNYLAGSYTLTQAAGVSPPPVIYPMLNYRGGLETRFTFAPVSASLGYKFAAFSNADGRGYDQLWHGPALSVGVQW